MGIQVWVLWRTFQRHRENVNGASQINLPVTSLERQIRMVPWRQIQTSLRWSSRIFSRRPGTLEGKFHGTFWGPKLPNCDDLYIVSKFFLDRIKESLSTIPIILFYLLLLFSICSLKSRLESKINPRCFWLLASCALVPLTTSQV